jgi:hypothetical protein
MSEAVREATIQWRLLRVAILRGWADGPLPSGHGALISAT